MNKELLLDLLNKKLSLAEIGKETNLSKSSINYYITKFDLRNIFDTYKNYKKGKKVYKIEEKDNIENSIKKASSIREALQILNRNESSSSYKWFISRAKFYNINYSHFNKKRGRKRLNNEECFVVNSFVSRSVIKKRIIEKNLIPYSCFYCSNDGVWNNKKLVLILDHINGIRNDNRIENLRFVCPNCNSQLDTHCKGNYKPS